MTYKIQIDDEVRDATDQEIAAIEARKSEKIALDQAAAEKAEAKAAIADRLGLTDAELAILLA
jgi:hypothetical protein